MVSNICQTLAAGAVYETSEERMKECNTLLKRSGGEGTLEAAKASAAEATEAQG